MTHGRHTKRRGTFFPSEILAKIEYRAPVFGFRANNDRSYARSVGNLVCCERTGVAFFDAGDICYQIAATDAAYAYGIIIVII